MFLSPGTPLDALCTLANAANTMPFALSAKDLYAGKPKSLPDGSVELPVVTMYDSVYEGTVKLVYDRIDLSKVFSGIHPEIHSLGASSLHKLLPMISAALGIYLTPDDVVDVNLSWLGNNEQVNIQLLANPNSLGFTGTFIVKYNRVRPALNTSIRTKALNTLRHPIPPTPGTQSVDMLTWGIDFTDYKSRLIPGWIMGWTNLPTVQAVMAELGIPSFPDALPGKLLTRPTADVPESNKNFAFVMTQSDIVGPGYAGTAYLHYN